MKCTVCKLDKDDSEFTNPKKWKICRSCKSEKDKAYYQANKEKIKKQVKKYAKENSEKIKEYHKKKRQRYKENSEWLEKRRETCREWARQHRKNNPEKARQSGRKAAKERRARIAAALTEPWTHEEIAASGTGFCPYCKKWIGLIYDSTVMHVDHIIPLSRGGNDTIENLETVCCECNGSKWTKTKEEFLNERG